MSSILGGLVDFAIAFVILLGMMWFYKIPLTAHVLVLPLLLLLTMVTAFGDRFMAFGPECALQGCELYHALPDPVLAFYHPDCLSHQFAA